MISQNGIVHGPDDRRAALLIPPLAALLLVLVLVFFVWFDTSAVDGDSMLPTFRDQDHLLVTRGYEDPVRGDLVAATAVRSTGSVGVIKRVVALAGDEVVVDGDRVWVNGSPALPADAIIGERTRVQETTIVPEGMVYLLGDNRPVSLDSRFEGPFALSDIRGRIVAVYSPVTRLRFVDAAAGAD